MTSEPHRRTIGSLRAVALDAPDIDRLATFYEQFAGWQRVPDDDEWITLDTGDGWRMGLQRATGHEPPHWPDQDRPQQAHLDFRVPDIDAAAERAQQLGVTRPSETRVSSPSRRPTATPCGLLLVLPRQGRSGQDGLADAGAGRPGGRGGPARAAGPLSAAIPAVTRKEPGSRSVPARRLMFVTSAWSWPSRVTSNTPAPCGTLACVSVATLVSLAGCSVVVVPARAAHAGRESSLCAVLGWLTGLASRGLSLGRLGLRGAGGGLG